jgi:hypothetical protein
MASTQRFREKALRRLGITRGAQQELQGVPLRVHSTGEIHPDPFDLDIRFLDAPGVGRLFEMRSATLLQLRRVLLHPAENGGMIESDASLLHHPF